MPARRLLEFAERLCARIGLPMLERRAVGITEPCARRSAIVLAPHPDDETLGCGSAILHKLAAGSRVAVVLATDGRHSHHSSRLSGDELVAMRDAEFRDACARLGLEQADADSWGFCSWGFEDGTLGKNEDELVRRIVALIERLDPQELLIPSDIDGHADHRALHRAAVRAARETDFPGHVLAYPVWFWTIKADLAGRRPTPMNLVRAVCGGLRTLLTIKTASVRTEGVLDRKLDAIKAYDSQLHAPPEEPAWATIPDYVLRRFLRERELYFPIETKE